ncbi:MAG: DUF2812 domain-containing protein [Anaerovoracaceae bacterium]
MRREIFKIFWAWDYGKEEMWLNSLAAKGLALVSVSAFKYTFEESEPGEYQIRQELMENLPSNSESVQYIRFLEDTGVEYLGSVVRQAYFRKKSIDGKFDLFSDNASRIKHLKRLVSLLAVLAVAMLINSLSTGIFYFSTGEGIMLALMVLCIVLCVLLGYGTWRIIRSIRRLQKDMVLFE